MKKADYTFHRDVRHRVEAQTRPNERMFYSGNNPIFIPKNKKKKSR
jgi:hypothetical protein